VKLIVLTGPTAVGKTELALTLAEQLRTPIINADSRQMYRELKIGTAPPTAEQMKRVKHYFVGTLSLGDYYNASIFEQEVMQLLTGELSQQEYVLMTGGSMMYIDAVCNGIDDIPTVNIAIRTEMKRRLTDEGLEALTAELKAKDPDYAATADLKNPKRVVHALEIIEMTGCTYTSFRTNQRKQRPFEVVKIALNRDRQELYQRIDQRVEQMMADGLEQEARQLFPRRGINALNTVGYKELFSAFEGKCTVEEAKEKIKFDTHRYARKQITWFRRDDAVRWYHPDEQDKILRSIYENDRQVD